MSNAPLARLGRWSHSHRWTVVIAWAVFAVALGYFAPRLDHALSGAMWEVKGSDSLAAREIVEEKFGGFSSQSAAVVLHSDSLQAGDPAFQERLAAVTAVFASEEALGQVAPPMVSADGRTVMLQAATLVNPTESVRAAERISGDIDDLSGNGITVALTGAPAFWADFNAVNREAMMKSELFSWPITAAVLVLAFGSLAAAGLPLLLTGVGLVSAMGVLYGITRFTDLSIWTLNFAMMFALALGIDYALFIVSRFRGALHYAPNNVNGAVGVAMDTAGKAVLFSGITVIISLSAVLLVPVPAFQSMAAGMMLDVGFVLLAAMTLLPALLGPGINRLALPWHSIGEHRSPRWAAWARSIQRRPVLAGAAVTVLLLALAAPLLRLDTGMPAITVLPGDKQARVGYGLLAEAFGPGGPGPIQVVVPRGTDAGAVQAAVAAVPGVAMAFPAQPGADGYSLVTAFATSDPSSKESNSLIAAIREAVPAGTLVGGPVAENHDLDQTLRDRAPVVIGVVLVLGFALLLFALQAVFIAAAGVVLNLLSVGAAFGIGALAFQHGWAAGPMGFESQGYLTSWAPLFFFTLVFAISMDYTVFLLASAREHFERSRDAKEAVEGSLAHTGRPIVAAAGVMVAVFFTFAIAGPLPMKEMGIILGVAVLADAFLVRLVLVPAMLTLAGKNAWWLPRWADRVLPDIRFAH
ncbi:MAG: MMPL family transporter [Chloroflexi bacterium CFX7]|nr:MMPL family transporter [Chloroflexi bacterium CFX7]